MTKSDKEEEAKALAAGLKSATTLQAFATNKGMEVATDILKAVVKCYGHDPFMHQEKEMEIAYQATINTFMIYLLRTVQKTGELIAATGLLTSEGIPWKEQNLEPEEIFSEADRLVREAEAEATEGKQ
jgi:hypothetical protein